MLDKITDKVFVINLDRRPERWQQIAAELNRIGITQYERFAAIDGQTLDASKYAVSTANMGCTLSHLAVTKLARQRGYKSYCVLEDDCIFADNFSEVFPSYWAQVPDTFHMVYLGGSHEGVKLQNLAPNLYKMVSTLTTHAMIISSGIYDAMIDLWENTKEEVDNTLRKLHPNNNCYTFSPPLAWQRAGFSDILGKEDDYKHLKEEVKK